MLTVKLEMVLIIVVMSTPQYLVRSARPGPVSHHTSMGMEVLEITISVVILMERLMPGATP